MLLQHHPVHLPDAAAAARVPVHLGSSSLSSLLSSLLSSSPSSLLSQEVLVGDKQRFASTLFSLCKEMAFKAAKTLISVKKVGVEAFRYVCSLS